MTRWQSSIHLPVVAAVLALATSSNASADETKYERLARLLAFHDVWHECDPPLPCIDEPYVIVSRKRVLPFVSWCQSKRETMYYRLHPWADRPFSEGCEVTP